MKERDIHKGIHKGHRERLRRRFLNEGLSSFEAHNILELLLFYCIPQRDTNPLAHQLIQRFGSVSGVLEADVEQLKEIEYIGENAAILLRLVGEICQSYESTRAIKTIEKRYELYKTGHVDTMIAVQDFTLDFPELKNEEKAAEHAKKCNIKHNI